MTDRLVLKVLSYNIHKGFSSGHRRAVLEQMRQAIRSVDADIVFLQEVVGDHRKARFRRMSLAAQFEFLADGVWEHHAYGKNAVYSDGHHGNAILSKFPFSFWENLDVSTNRFEQRGILHGVIAIPGFARAVHLLCLHLNLFEMGRRHQIETLCDRVAATVHAGEPLIIGGDFNDWRQRISKGIEQRVGAREIFQQLYGEHARTFPSFFPLLRLDRLYYRDLEAVAAGCLTDHPWKDLSDHLGVYGQFALAAL